MSFIWFFLHFGHIDRVDLANATQRLLTFCLAGATASPNFLRAGLLWLPILTEYIASDALKIWGLGGNDPAAVFRRPRLRRKQLTQFERWIVADRLCVGSATAPVPQLVVWLVMTVVMVDPRRVLEHGVVTRSMIARASWKEYFLKYITGALGFFLRFTLVKTSLLTIWTHGHLMAINTYVTISNRSWWIFFFWNLIIIVWIRFFGGFAEHAFRDRELLRILHVLHLPMAQRVHCSIALRHNFFGLHLRLLKLRMLLRQSLQCILEVADWEADRLFLLFNAASIFGHNWLALVFLYHD